MHIHIVGIAGTMTAPLASELKRLGHHITGSDQNKIYPPVSTILSKAKIKPNTKIDITKVDLGIIGSSFKAFANTTAEYNQIKKNKIPYISATKYISKFVAKKNSILVAGSFGKTTITSLLSWIFFQLKYDPSYMFAGEPKNSLPPLHIGKSDFSVIEADESINGLDNKAKFLYYPVKYLLLTSAGWEHKDSYKTAAENFNAFNSLVSKIPDSGFLVTNPAAENITQIIPNASCKVITYGNDENDYSIAKVDCQSNKTIITIKTPYGTYKVATKLIGVHNFQNILAAVALCFELKLPQKKVIKAIGTFKGVKRRLEKVADYKDILFYDDFAQAPNRVESALCAIKAAYPDRNIKVFFEPHASFLAHRQSLSGFDKSFSPASEVILGKIPFKADIGKDARSSAKDYRTLIGDKLQYIPILEDTYNFYCQNLKPNDLLIHFSSGGLDGLRTFRRIINYFKKSNSN